MSAPPSSGVIAISGRLTVDGRGASEQRILALSAEMRALIASALTGSDGRFAIELPPDYRDRTVVLVGKVQGAVLGIVHRIVAIEDRAASEQELDVDTREGFHIVHATITSRGAMPDDLQISVTPAQLDGVPAPIESYFLRQSATVADAAFLEDQVAGREFEMTVQRGVWRIAGAHIDYRRPMRRTPGPDNFIVSRIDADGESRPLPGTSFGGFTLDVHRDRHITLSLDVLPDTALGTS